MVQLKAVNGNERHEPTRPPLRSDRLYVGRSLYPRY